MADTPSLVPRSAPPPLPNCAEYHDVHHQMTGLRYNYSQPFFVHFDVLFGTRISAEKFQKDEEARRGKACS